LVFGIAQDVKLIVMLEGFVLIWRYGFCLGFVVSVEHLGLLEFGVPELSIHGAFGVL
jgi:hypothetical protein